MFDTILSRQGAPKGRHGHAALISLGVHLLVVPAAIWPGSTPESAATAMDERPSVFMVAVPRLPAAPPPLGGEAQASSKSEAGALRRKVPGVSNAAKDSPPADPRPPSAGTETGASVAGIPDGAREGQSGGSDRGDPGGVPWGSPDGVPRGNGTGGLPAPAPVDTVLQYSTDMGPLVVLRSPPIAYTREAMETRVEGKVRAKCTLMPDGTLQGCRVLNSLPHLDGPVRDYLRDIRYQPLKVDGTPQKVSILVTIHFVLKD